MDQLKQELVSVQLVTLELNVHLQATLQRELKEKDAKLQRVQAKVGGVIEETSTTVRSMQKELVDEKVYQPHHYTSDADCPVCASKRLPTL